MAAGKGEVKIGDRVKHSKLGEGDVLDVHPLGEETCAVISFEQWGQKKIILKYAKIEILPELEEEIEEPGAKGEKAEAGPRAKKATKAKPKKVKKETKPKKPKKETKPKKGKKS